MHQDNVECNYCGGQHYIWNCDKVEEDIKEGKCKKNHEGKIVLPNRFFVSRSIGCAIASLSGTVKTQVIKQQPL